ncbi:MAG: hypothetical protein KZQ83_00470 [gamma proteobacterium symbiont of Taylorina sp.]|nr:hypothetical protein [gamma proteobacterium symbiont of Taylorina sp.]
MSKKLIVANNLTSLVLHQNNEVALNDSRRAAHISDAEVKQTVINHSLYQDKAGKKSSSPAGLVMQINKKVKSHFALSVDEMSVDELLLLVALRNAIVRIITDGEKNELLRKEIKRVIYDTIEKYGQLILGLQEVA